MKPINVALAGNPNAGKTTLFNALTGSHQRVGNWPGKTVKQKRGSYRYHDLEYEVVDLPGTYSLSAFSEEEIIARDYLLQGNPDVVVVVEDTSNLERNLYLVVQLLELQVNPILALNMSDIADSQGYQIDLGSLSSHLGSVPVVRIVANQGEGLQDLKRAIASKALRLDPQRASTTEMS